MPPPLLPSSLRSAPSVSGPKAGRIHLPQHSLRSRGGDEARALDSRLSALGSRLSALDSRLSALGSRLSTLDSEEGEACCGPGVRTAFYVGDVLEAEVEERRCGETRRETVVTDEDEPCFEVGDPWILPR